MSYRPNLPVTDAGAARVTDSRFYGIERVDLRARYGAPLDGTLHPLSTMGLSAAQALYPNIGLTGSTSLSTFAQDTAAFLQAEYDMRTGSGGIIGLPDAGQGYASQSWWLKNGGKVHLHGGRFTAILGEACGSTPVVRVSNASGNTSSASVGPGHPECLKDVTLFAWNAGRAYFGGGGGAAPPGYATAAAMAGNPGGYRTGSCALQIDDGGAAGQASGLSGPASVYAAFSGVRWFNFDDATRWGDDTFSILLADCMGENNASGIRWRQTTGLNSMERMVIERGSYSNNGIGLDINCTWTDGGGTHPQGGSWLIQHASIDYNLVKQARFILAQSGEWYPNNSVHLTGNHIENDAATLGAASTWIDVQGVLKLGNNEFYINGAAPTTGLVGLGDNSSGTMLANDIHGYCPLFYSPTSNFKEVHAYGNTCSGLNGNNPVVALADLNGKLLQARAANDPTSLDIASDFTLNVNSHCNLSTIGLTSGCTKITLPTNDANSLPVGYTVTLVNKTSLPITTRVPVGIFSAGLSGYADNKTGSATVDGPIILPNAIVVLRRRILTDWIYWPDIVTYTNATGDSDAATKSVPVNGFYRNGSVLQVRVA